jgi:hypothetical protein
MHDDRDVCDKDVALRPGKFLPLHGTRSKAGGYLCCRRRKSPLPKGGGPAYGSTGRRRRYPVAECSCRAAVRKSRPGPGGGVCRRRENNGPRVRASWCSPCVAERSNIRSADLEGGMNWFDADQISPTGFYEFRWLATVQPAHNTPNGQPKNWIISRDRLNAARRRGRLIVCPNKPTLVRGDHLLAFLKGKTSLHAGPGSLTAKASRPRPSENHRSQIGAKS